MTFNALCISSGHGKYIRGASDLPLGLDEVDEARKVVEAVAIEMRARGAQITTFHDDTSHDQDTNLNTIVNFHNKQARQADCSCHFNAYEHTEKAMGVEVLYYSENVLAGEVSKAIASAGSFINRGPKQRKDLFFLAHTNKPAILWEICFCDSMSDTKLYKTNFDKIIRAIADSLVGVDATVPIPPPKPEIGLHVIGKASYFGGPGDTTGMTADEGLAFLYKQRDKPEVFLAGKPLDSPARGWDLNPHVHYFACRFDYDVTPKSMLAGKQVALVRAATTGIALTAMPSDWGPNSNTGRVADLSPSLMADLQISTDDEVEIIYPYDPPKVA